MITKEKKDGMLQQSKSDKPFVKKNFIFMAVSMPTAATASLSKTSQSQKAKHVKSL